MKDNIDKKSKKILNVVSVFFSLPFFLGDQLIYFTHKGYIIHLVCSPSDKIEKFANDHLCQYKEIDLLRKISLFADIKATWQLYQYIKKEKFNIVCGHTPKGGLLSMIAAFIARIPQRVYFRHGLRYETCSGLKRTILIYCERIASMLATKVVCVSNYLIEKSIDDHLSSQKKMILLNYGSCNGVDALKQFNPNQINKQRKELLRKELHLPQDAFIMGYAGRLVHDKGITQLVQAFEKLSIVYPNIYLLLIGPYEDGDRLPSSTISTIKENNKIIHTGLIEKEIEYYYSLMDIYILPSYREGLPTCILEASAMQIPVLTTSHSGSRDSMINQETGIYVKIDKDDIADKTEMLYNDATRRKQLGINGRKFVLKYFNQQKIWEDIEHKLYL